MLEKIKYWLFDLSDTQYKMKRTPYGYAVFSRTWKKKCHIGEESRYTPWEFEKGFKRKKAALIFLETKRVAEKLRSLQPEDDARNYE